MYINIFGLQFPTDMTLLRPTKQVACTPLLHCLSVILSKLSQKILIKVHRLQSYFLVGRRQFLQYHHH